MISVRIPRRLGWVVPVVAVAFLSVVFCAGVSAQAVAEAAGATSVAAGVAAGGKPPVIFPKFPNLSAPGAAPSGTQHLIASAGPPPQETNVREFQALAGKDAGKVLLRAAPTQAQIWVNGKVVGKTPLLLVLAPGKYEIEMRGARGETGKSTVTLLPRETREVVVSLHSLYPARVTAPKQ